MDSFQNSQMHNNKYYNNKFGHQQFEHMQLEPEPTFEATDLYIIAEKEHLQQFIHDAREVFDHVLTQKVRFGHHLCEFYHRIQTRKFLFVARVGLLQYKVEYLEVEVKIIYESIQILESYLQILDNLIENPTECKDAMPNMQVVQKVATELLDRIVAFQAKLFDTLILPLDCLEKELQQCINADLAGITCWQQDLQMYGEWRSVS